MAALYAAIQHMKQNVVLFVVGTGRRTNSSTDRYLRLTTTGQPALPARDSPSRGIPHRATCAESRKLYPAAGPDVSACG